VNGVIDLRETSPCHWQAKYQGNYGVYTIKITTDGKRTEHFSCSCPSSGYPCKHIGMIERAIAERIARNVKRKKDEPSAEELLKKLSREELYNFIARMIQNNPDLSNAVLLEFSDRIDSPNGKNGNKYVSIIRRGLAATHFNEEDYYEDEMGPQVDILDQWFQRAWQYLKEKKIRDAVLISRACIEEYASWLEQLEGELSEYMDEGYQSEPFEILEKAAADPGTDPKELYDYCMAEMAKKKYAGLDMLDGFNRVLMKVSARVDPEGFIALQYKLLEEIEDKSSYRAKKILTRIVDFYTGRRQAKKAWQCIEDNMQIESFRAKAVEMRIAKKDFAGAKKIIRDYLDGEGKRGRPGKWEDYLLRIAKEEQDTRALRDLSFSFIKDEFEEKYYRIYKSSFDAAEWPGAFEKLFRLYETNKKFWGSPAADLLAAEGKAERLMDLIEEKLTLEILERYYQYFVSAFSEKTLVMFRRALDSYTEQYTGRTYYEHIVAVFRTMKKIPGGAAVVKDMTERYGAVYKNRPAMMEILNRKR
jgi:hypothetical protein